MIHTYTFDGETWVDIDNGTPEEITGIMDTYKIHPFVAKELISSTRKPRIELYNEYIYCILHFPAFKHSHAKESNQEVDFIIGKNLLITAHYDTIDALHKFSKTLEVKEILEKKDSNIGVHTIFTGLLQELYSGLFDELDYIEDQTLDITGKIFKGFERQMVIAISETTRTLLDFKRAIDLHQDVLDVLSQQGEQVFGKDFATQIKSIILDYLKINSTIRSNLEVLRELRDTNNAMLSTKQNEIMKQLTILGAVILPLSIITGIFGMSIHTFPLMDNPDAFWIILSIMLCVVLITFIYARHKKWM